MRITFFGHELLFENFNQGMKHPIRKLKILNKEIWPK